MNIRLISISKVEQIFTGSTYQFGGPLSRPLRDPNHPPSHPNLNQGRPWGLNNQRMPQAKGPEWDYVVIVDSEGTRQYQGQAHAVQQGVLWRGGSVSVVWPLVNLRRAS